MVKAAIWTGLCLLVACGLQQAQAKGPLEVQEGAILRDANMRGLNGPSRKLSQYRGKPLLINVWASWCGPCKQEMGSLERLAWRDEAKQFNIIGISTDDFDNGAREWDDPQALLWIQSKLATPPRP